MTIVALAGAFFVESRFLVVLTACLVITLTYSFSFKRIPLLDVSVVEITGRGYRGSDWPITLTFGIGFGLASIIIMLLYMANDAMPSGFYWNPAWLYAIPALLTIWVMRVWLLSNRMILNEDPVVFALYDGPSILLGLAVAIAFYLAL